LKIHVDTPTGPRIVHARGTAGVQRAIDLVFKRDLQVVGGLPPLYETGIRYKRERRGGLEDFKSADRCLRDWNANSKNGCDCDDLAPWRAAELVVSGVDPEARPFVYRPRERLMHVIVARGDGTLEDPSAMLGMRNTMINGVQYRFRGGRGSVECGLSIPVGGEKVRGKGYGTTRAEALLDARNKIVELLDGELDNDAEEEVGWVALVIAAAMAIASALAPRFKAAPYEAVVDYPRIARAKGITLDETSREAMFASLIMGGWLPIYCSDSQGTRDNIFREFEKRGWTGAERWSNRHGSLAAQDVGLGTWWYGVHFPLANVPREWAERAVARAKTFPDPAESIKRTGEFCIDAKHRMRAYGGDEDFDAMMLDAIPVVFVPDAVSGDEEEVGGFAIPGLGELFGGTGGGTIPTGAGGSPSLSTSNPFAGGSQAKIPPAGGGGLGGALGAAVPGIIDLLSTPAPAGPNYAGTGPKGSGAFVDAMRGGSGIPGAPTGAPPAGGGIMSTWAPGGTDVTGPRSNTGLQLAPGTGTAPAPEASERLAAPVVAPITFDKLDKIRELAELVRDGSVHRVRSVVRQGGPLGRLARELLR